MGRQVQHSFIIFQGLNLIYVHVGCVLYPSLLLVICRMNVSLESHRFVVEFNVFMLSSLSALVHV